MGGFGRQTQQRTNTVETVDPVRALSDAGFRSGWAYIGGFASIVLSVAAWALSRRANSDRAQADRWGIFIGHWAPTFFALGIALKQEEQERG